MEEEVPGKSVKLGSSVGAGEVDYKTKAGTAWSHSYLNQKPWHPLSYPNQRRKWIAEQINANRTRRQEEVAREFAQEQEFFRQTALFNQKEKEKMEMVKAVSFMYVRPPGYNAESAKAAEIADENKASGSSQDPVVASSSQMGSGVDKERKARPKDVFGRALPSEHEFEVLKNAPRLDTGVATRSKPFGVEIRNVKCVRCGAFGHQSGDRECPLKDMIMPNDESRLKRDDPLNAILAQTDTSEPLKWELKQKPGMSPPRGGFRPDDPNQQIVADHDEIFDEYGGFLTGGDIPALLSNFPLDKPKKKKKKHHGSKSKSTKRVSSSESESESEPNKSKRSKSKHKKHYSSDSDKAEKSSRRRSKNKYKSQNMSDSSLSLSEDDRYCKVGPDDGRHHSSRRNEKRESKNLDKDTNRSKSTEIRSKKLKEEKNATACPDTSEPDSDSQRCRHQHHHHHSPSSSEDDRYHETGRYDGRYYSGKRSKKRESENLDKDTDRSKCTETRNKKLKDEKHVSMCSDTSKPDLDSQRRRHQHRHHHHHAPSLSEDDGYRETGRYDGRHYSSKRSKKRGSELNTDEGKHTDSRSNLIKDEKHVSAYSNTSEFDSDCRRHNRHHHHHGHRH